MFILLYFRKKERYTDQPPPSKTSIAPAPTPGLMPTEMEATAQLGSMYADPRSIEHEPAPATGEEYALVSKPPPAKMASNQVKQCYVGGYVDSVECTICLMCAIVLCW